MGTTNARERRSLQALDGSLNGGCVEGDDKLSTTDATVTKISESDVVAVGEAVIMKAMIIGRKSDGTAAAGVEKWGVFRRQSAGNVTLVGTVQGTTQTDGVTPAITIAANTTNQTVEARVAGIAAENWVWECNWSKLKV